MSTKRKQEEEEDPEFAPASKQQKMEEAEEDLGMFEKAPEEIREMIIDYLPVKDLLNLASTNKAFNHYIGSKSRYMQNVVVNFEKIHWNVDWCTERMYENLRFTHTLVRAHTAQKKWLINVKDNVKSVTFNCHFSKLSTAMVKYFANLERIYIEKFTNFRQMVFSLPNLRYLEIRENASFHNSIDGMFGNCQLKSLKLYKSSPKNMILKQTGLEELHASRDLFNDIKMSQVQFKLKKLSLTEKARRFNYYTVDRSHNFKLAINVHRETLKELKSNTIDMLNFFNEFENLQTVELVKVAPKAIDMSQCNMMQHIQKLVLTSASARNITCFNGLDTIEKNFPNLLELSIENGNMKSTSQLFAGLTKLEKLTLKITSGLTEMHIPHVESLKLHNCGFLATQKPFELDDNRIRKLTIDGCFDESKLRMKWLLAFLEHEDTNLDYLEIRNLKLPDTFEKVFKNNAHKVKKLIKP